MLDNITWILCINSTNRLFFFFNSWFYFSYDRYKNLRGSLFWVFRKKKNLLLAWFLVKFILPVRSIMLANWFAWNPACMSAIAQVLLASPSTCTNQTVKWMNKFFWMKEIELYYFFSKCSIQMNVWFKWFCSIAIFLTET